MLPQIQQWRKEELQFINHDNEACDGCKYIDKHFAETKRLCKDNYKFMLKRESSGACVKEMVLFYSTREL